MCKVEEERETYREATKVNYFLFLNLFTFLLKETPNNQFIFLY